MSGQWREFLTTGPHFAGLLLCACLAGAAAAEEIAPDGLDTLPRADVVILGEIHDNPAHHANQARAVHALAPAAIVFEMFGPDAAARLGSGVPLEVGAMAEALGWDEGGWPDFADYFPIFEAAPGAVIRGGAFPVVEVRRAVTEGAAAVMGADAARFGLDRVPEPDELSRRIALQGAAHCDAMPAELLPGMVEAQRLRDAGLARAIVEALDETGGPVAVITGNGHARTDWGVPRVIGEARPGTTILSVGQFEAAPAEDPPHDLWLVTEPAGREDPCAAFSEQPG